MAKLTKTMLAHAQAAVRADGKERFLWDSEVKGFGGRVRAESVSFVLDYRHGRVHRRMVIGRLGEIDVPKARARAAELKLQVRAGADTLAELRAKRKPVDRGTTVATELERWTHA